MIHILSALLPARRLPRSCKALLLLTCLVFSHTANVQAQAVKSSGGRSSSSSSSSSSSTSSTSSSSTSFSKGTSISGSSYGASTRTVRVISATIVLIVIFNGYHYPYVRYTYGDYYDDCILRNATAAQQNTTDALVDATALDALSGIMPNASAYNNIAEYNTSLFNVTNGLIVDPAYCNYTYIGSGSGAARAPVLATLLLALITIVGAHWGWV